LHGSGHHGFDFQFDLPAQCADALGTGQADIGLAPCAELDRLGLDFLPGLGIACEGPVRSILLISKVPFERIRSLAVDSGSRTSVALARILLADRYGCNPTIAARPPEIDRMLDEADAALIIGDAALRIEPHTLPWKVLDLGAEWVQWTGLPMVFAVWAGRRELLTPEVSGAFTASYRWGAANIEEIVRAAEAERGFPADLAREYLTRHIVYELGTRHLEGLALFRDKVRSLEEIHFTA
jgi:predicted solute-binding protein